MHAVLDRREGARAGHERGAPAKMCPMVFRVLPLLFGSVLASFCQSSYGRLTGRAVDLQGAVIVGAKVLVTQSGTNIVTASATNTDGLYDVPNLLPGPYSVEISLDGFRRHTRSGVGVRVGDVLSLDVTLEVGSIAESVSVTGEAPLLETTTASSGQVIDNKQLSALRPGSELRDAVVAHGRGHRRAHVRLAAASARFGVEHRSGGCTDPRQRVHARRDSEHGARRYHRVSAAARNDPGVPRADRRLRRRARKVRGRQREHGARQRRQRLSRRAMVLPPEPAIDDASVLRELQPVGYAIGRARSSCGSPGCGLMAGATGIWRCSRRSR